MVHISASVFLTLDGVMEAPHVWHPPFVSGKSLAILEQQLATADALLLGRRAYEEFAYYWPQQPESMPLAAATNGIRRYVVSRHLTDPSWGDTRVLATGLTEGVRQLAERESDLLAGRESRVLAVGGIELIRGLLRAGLVDDLRIMLDPQVVGAGRRLFTGGFRLPRLELVEAQPLPHGVLHLVYLLATTRADEHETDPLTAP